MVNPDLIVMDCFRILKANGPQGGSLRDVANPQIVVAGTDPVAIDSYGATLFGLTGQDISYIKIASEAGMGQIDLSQVEIRKTKLG